MQRVQLVRSRRASGKEVYFANTDHPEADVLSRLAAADVPHRSVPEEGDDELKQKLVSLGVPLRGVKPSPVARAEVLNVLVSGTELARRDAVLARGMPLCFWNNRDQLDVQALQGLSLAPEEKHALAFFLELAGELGGDRRLTGLAEGLRDQRLTQPRPFFYSMTLRSARDFTLATKWGFLMNTELDSFRALFDKFVTK